MYPLIFKKKNVVCVGLLAIHISGYGAVEPNDITQRQQERDEALRAQIQPDVNVNLKQPVAQTSPQNLSFLRSHSELMCFDINKIKVQGEQTADFLNAFKEITQGTNNIIGRCLGVQGLNQAMDVVQNRIIADGYVTTRLLLPPQNISTGTVVFRVIPGKVDQIKFTPGTSRWAQYWNALPIQSGDLLNIHDLEQGLENFKRVPTVEADFKIQPAEHNNQPAYSDIILNWNQSKPYRLHLGLDDAGSEATGKYQGTATLSLDNALTVNDLFYVSYNHDLGGGEAGNRGTDGFYASYLIPFDYWLFSSSYSRSNYLQTVAVWLLLLHRLTS